jgi:hypothetical protein
MIGMAGARDLVERPAFAMEGDLPLPCLDEAFAGLRLYYAVTGAVEIGLFDRLRVPMIAADLAAALGSRPHETALLCETLADRGLLVREGPAFRNGPEADAFLAADSPYAIRGMLAFQQRHAERWRELPRLLREGPEVLPRERFFRDTVIPSMAEHARCGLVQHVTDLVAGLPEFGGAETLLDLGGGHGLYSIAFCQKNPGLRATVFDLPAVTGATRDFIARYGADRVSVVAGDFNTDPLPGPFDIVFSSSNPGGKDPRLVPKIAGALCPGGLFLNKQGVDGETADPLGDLEWNLWTFEGVEKQQSRYTFSHSVPLGEYHRALEANGLSVLAVVPVDGTSEMTVARKEG